MDMNAVDYGTIIAFVLMILKLQNDKAKASEELGRMKEQLRTLENKATANDQRFAEIDSKLSHLVESNARLEGLVKVLVSREQGNNIRFLETPAARRG